MKSALSTRPALSALPGCHGVGGANGRVTAPDTVNHGAHSPISIRPANLADLDALVDIGLTAMPLDPQWNWRFQHRFEFPEDNRASTRKIYREFLDPNSADWRVMLAEVPVDGSRHALRPIAFAVWNLGNLATLPSTAGKSLSTAKDCKVHPHWSPTLARRDANADRMKAWTEAISTAKAQLFDKAYRRQYLQLQILATHPHFHRQGAATALCHWGLKLAGSRGLAVVVFASPMGAMLYARLGFAKLDNVRIRVHGEQEEINIAAMAYAPDTPVPNQE